MAKNNSTIEHIGSRIIYIEPNDVAGNVNGVPVTPDYTDFCISFDLIVEVVSRTKANEISKLDREQYLNGVKKDNDALKTYVFSWTSKYNPNGSEDVEKNESPNVVSFMSGAEYKKHQRYLTTYYTDTHYNDIKKSAIVEGLGVESVNVSFESYYTPTVKMRFIDVRGSSIFGREEYTHTDEVLAEDNIWGCFFTFPYPKYKLQIKGFYGRAVTFQLCCTDFRANFNPQTGNFEIDMSFLGYDFGLLADIPMQYLIAAPYSHYADTAMYWSKQASSNPHWQMSNGVPPITFKEMIRYIKSAIEIYGENGGKAEVDTYEVEKEIIDQEKTSVLDEMEPYINDIKEFMADYDNKYVKELGKEGVRFSIIHSNKVYPFEVVLYSEPSKEYYNIRIDDKIFKTAWESQTELFKLINEYNEKWPEGGFENIKECYSTHFEKNKTDIGDPYYEVYNKDQLPLFKSQRHYYENDETQIKLNKLLNFYSDAREKTKSIVTETATRQSQAVEKKQNIMDVVKFIPNIGNVFRILYCHLETFVHMVYTCTGLVYSQMKNKDRTLQKLGIPSWENTDIDARKLDEPKQVVPFPGIYTFKNVKGDDETGQEEDDNIQTNVWVGDLRKESNVSLPWEEELMIEELFKAVLFTKTDNDNAVGSFSSTSFPVLPCDINYDQISGIGMGDSADHLAGYLALRMAALFDIADYKDDEAEEAGVADAIQYFESWGIKDVIKEKILKNLGNGNKSDALLERMLCTGYADANPMPFEAAQNLTKEKPKRQPFFIKKGDSLEYVYSDNNDYTDFVPIRLSSWNGLSDVLDYHGNSTPGQSYYNLKLTQDHSNVLYDMYSTSILGNLEETPEIIEDYYYNNEIFNVYYGDGYGDGSMITEKLEEMYDKLADGAISLHGYSAPSNENRFKKLLQNHWKNVKKDTYDALYKNTAILYPDLETLGVTEDDGFKGYDKVSKKRKTDKVVHQEINGKTVTKNSDGKYVYNSKEISEEKCQPLIPSITVYTKNNNLNSYNIFTSRIYYMQNSWSDIYGTNTVTFQIDGKTCEFKEGTGTREETCDRVKAFLFLNTLSYTNTFSVNFWKNEENSSVIEGVPLGYLLYMGGLLWRKRFYEINSFDPIITQAANYLDGKKIDNVLNRVYKKLNSTEIPFFEKNTGVYNKGFIEDGANKSYESYTKLIKSQPDIAISNKLIKLFKDFVNKEWQTIKETCELKSNNGGLLGYGEFSQLESAGSFSNLYTQLSELTDGAFKKNYFYMNVFTDGKGIASVFSPSNPALSTIKNINNSKIIVQKTVSRFYTPKTSHDVSLSVTTAKKYLNGFVEQLEEIVNSENSAVIESSDVDNENDNNKDIKRLMYEFIKNMWDRWFVGTPETLYSCESYISNTMFIDSMYRNVYENIHINCETLLDLLLDVGGKSMVFKFLSDITTKHNCMFFALPDYLNLSGTKEIVNGVVKTKETNIEDAMSEIFVPIPFTRINPIEASNKYIVMFTHKPSEINATTNSYTYDHFDIYSHDEDENYILPTFKKKSLQDDNMSEHDKQCTRYGYNLPAFGVEFGRQHNAIFKRVNIGMQNPIQTEQSIEALSMIAERGRGASQRNIFYGQDLYSVYSGYSYTATIEMMGNAQIMPLMYFQLFNVPMFRGAYMIYSVTHTMKPGDMTTTVKAMKMSKRTLPWCQEWYGHYYFRNDGTIDFVGDDECGAIDSDCKSLGNTDYHVSYNGHEEEISPKQRIRHIYDSKEQTLCASLQTTIKVNIRLVGGKTKEVSLTVNKYLADKFKEIFKCIYNGTYKNGGDAKINGKYFEFTSDVIGAYNYRKVNNPNKPESNSLSNHSYGVAVDINPGKNPFSCTKALKISNTDTETCIRTFNHPVVKIFKEFGFGWGGRYNDFMHFSYFDGR